MILAVKIVYIPTVSLILFTIAAVKMDTLLAMMGPVLRKQNVDAFRIPHLGFNLERKVESDAENGKL